MRKSGRGAFLNLSDEERAWLSNKICGELWSGNLANSGTWSGSLGGDGTATLTISDLPKHTHLRANLGITPSGGFATAGSITGTLDGQSLNLPFEMYQWWGETQIQHSDSPAAMNITGSGFEDADEDWQIDWDYLWAFTPVVTITGSATTTENGPAVNLTVKRDGNSAVWDKKGSR